PPILEMQLRREVKLNRHAAETPGCAGGSRENRCDQAAPSRSAVVSVRASFGRSRQSRALSSGVNEDGRRSGLSSGAAAPEDSYRFAAFSHEFRNLRKSSRVSLSAASCARAAHSAAFCLQYPIFSCMTVSALEPAALSISRQEPSSAKARRPQLPRSALSSNAEGGQSEACPPVNRHAGEDTRGYGKRCAFAHPTLSSGRRCGIFDVPRLRDGNRTRRRAFYPAGETSIEYAV